MRATTVLGMLSRLKDQGTVVRGFEVDVSGRTVHLDVVPTTRIGRCGECGRRVRGVYDTRPREWRHTDLGELQVVLRYPIRRLNCSWCGSPKTEQVPWAEHAAWHTNDFEDLTAYYAQQMNRTCAAQLLRTSWSTIGAIVGRVVRRKLPPDRLDGLRRIGIDELSYRKHHRYVTVVVDHDRHCIVWSAPGKTGDTVREFFEKLGPERTAELELVSLDMSAAYIAAVTECAPKAEIVFDRFHVQRVVQVALDEVRRTLVRSLRGDEARVLKNTRFALQKRRWNLSGEEAFKLVDVQRENRTLYRAYLMKEKFAAILDEIPAAKARRAIHAWCNAAVRSRIRPFVRAARTVRKHIDGIVLYVTTGLSNGRSEALNGKIRVLTRRAFGFHSAHALLAMINLCCSGLQLQPRHA